MSTLNRQTMPNIPGAPERFRGMVPGVSAGGFLFLSAIRGHDPFTGEMKTDPTAQARQALENVRGTLAASGATMEHVVKVTLYLDDLKKRAAFHDAWLEVYPENPPARIAVCVADANARVDGGAYFALDVIALAAS